MDNAEYCKAQRMIFEKMIWDTTFRAGPKPLCNDGRTVKSARDLLKKVKDGRKNG